MVVPPSPPPEPAAPVGAPSSPRPAAPAAVASRPIALSPAAPIVPGESAIDRRDKPLPGGGEVLARPVEPLSLEARWRRRNRRSLAMLVVGLLILLVTLIVLVHR